MTTRLALPVLNLLGRDSARDREFVRGASVWLREDVRLADGASRVVPAVFVEYRRRRDLCRVVRALSDHGTARPENAALDDVFARQWADQVDDERPRLAWAPPTVTPAALPIWPAVVALGSALVLGAVALYLLGLS